MCSPIDNPAVFDCESDDHVDALQALESSYRYLESVGRAILARFDLESDQSIFPGSALRDDLRKALGGPRQNAARRLRMICAKCGSTEVVVDAWAEWDESLQVWTLGAMFDYGECRACGGECRIEEIEIDAAGNAVEGGDDERA